MGKRLFDILISLLLLTVLSPLLLLLVLLVRIRLGRPVFFIQERPGKHGKAFRIYKFRSMTNVRDAEEKLLANSDRMTRLGSFLRSTSLDELPELWNVLKGDMSLVGPRPLLMEYLPLYTAEQARRHDIKPGITGWAQVNGRNAISFEEKLQYDIWYVDHLSFWLDFRIIWITVIKVLKREGINQSEGVIMPKYTGQQNSEES
ncbi:MAG: sugar transferase [Chlorobiales bacterium]|nr:sugar transferase [Chlorobiales bacterium]